LPESGHASDLRVRRLASAPTLSERRHRCFARRLVAVRGALDRPWTSEVFLL
jgi:hypothetical protein